jgi:glycosyltransferase involved in cell wall biosynthesis
MNSQKDSLEEIQRKIAASFEVPNRVKVVMPNPLVSVHVATYQHVDFIKTCIDSILVQQTTFPFELIIGEDFSTDGTREIIFDYARTYPEKIRVITADFNVKQSANHIRSIRACRGTYVALCDGDDAWTDPFKLQKQVDFLEQNPDYSMCYHSHQIRKNGQLNPAIYPKNPTDFSEVELIGCPSGMAVCTKMVRNVFNNLDLDVIYFFHGDFSINALMGTYGKSKYLAYVRPGIYNHHPGGVWTSAEESIRSRRLINTKIRIYQSFLNLGDHNSATIVLGSLRLTLQEKQLAVTNVHFNRSSIEWSLLGIQVGIYYGPFVSNIKNKLRRFIKRY